MEEMSKKAVEATKEMANAMRHAADKMEASANHATDEFAQAIRDGIHEGSKVTRTALEIQKEICDDLMRTTVGIWSETNQTLDTNFQRFQTIAIQISRNAREGLNDILQESARSIAMVTRESRDAWQHFLALLDSWIHLFYDLLVTNSRGMALLSIAIFNAATMAQNFDRHAITNAAQTGSSLLCTAAFIWWIMQGYEDSKVLRNQISNMQITNAKRLRRLRDENHDQFLILTQEKKDAISAEVASDQELRNKDYAQYQRDIDEKNQEIRNLEHIRDNLRKDLDQARVDHGAELAEEIARASIFKKKVKEAVEKEIKQVEEDKDFEEEFQNNLFVLSTFETRQHNKKRDERYENRDSRLKEYMQMMTA